jgi:hypothetical protein
MPVQTVPVLLLLGSLMQHAVEAAPLFSLPQTPQGPFTALLDHGHA